MYFDDRLATVLRTRADGGVTARIQYRQLLDLLGTLPAETRGVQVDAAYDRLAQLAETIPSQDRAAMVGEPGLRLRSPRLVASLAAGAIGYGESRIAEAAITKAQLSEEQWLDLVPALPVPARGFVRQRRDLGDNAEKLLARLGIRDRGLPDANKPDASKVEVSNAEAERPSAVVIPFPANDELLLTDEETPGSETIGSLVKRIEAFRRARRDEGDAALVQGDAPRLPLGEEPLLRAPQALRSFDFATDAAARIVWADPGVAPMAIGLSLASRDPASPVASASAVIEAVQRRQPIRAGRTTIAGSPAIAGEWQIDAAPSFDPVGGRFAGYRGRIRRPAEAAALPAVPADSEADRIRQLLHELRTPVNAIQGFAEIIQQQLFGPTPHEYRALAATIASDGARILAGFEDLERLARLDSGAQELDAGECDLAAVITTIVAQLEHHTAARSSGFAVKCDDGAHIVPLAAIEAERMIWRLLATLAGAAAPGEVLNLRIRRKQDMLRVTIQLPATLAARDDRALFHSSANTAPQALVAGMFGAGFALRLAASEARAAGGDLERREEKLRLTLPIYEPGQSINPGLTGQAHDHSQGVAAGPA